MSIPWRWLVNAVLLAIPIATTLGILLGLSPYERGNAGPGSPGSGGSPPSDNGISMDTYCQRAFGIHPPSDGQEYTLNPNQWGWEEGEPGSLCLNVTTHNNNTYATKTRAPEWSVTWQYPQGPETEPVHAFPNVMIENVFPATLSSLERIHLDFEWTYGVGNETSPDTDLDSLSSNSLVANVAIDMFLDRDRDVAGDSEEAAHEIMVWFATFGAAAQPIGLNDGEVATETLNGTRFSLYVGQNQQDQNVLTWVAEDTADDFHGDIFPLIERILSLGTSGYPTSSDYLGYMSLGSEAYSADRHVTFYVPELSMDVQKSGD